MVHPQTSCYVSRLLQHNENMARVPFFIHKLDILFNKHKSTKLPVYNTYCNDPQIQYLKA